MMSPSFHAGAPLFSFRRDLPCKRQLISARYSSDSIFSLTELEIMAMENLRPNMTGLDMVIFVNSGIGARHGPRIKVAKVYGPKVPTDGEPAG